MALQRQRGSEFHDVKLGLETIAQKKRKRERRELYKAGYRQEGGDVQLDGILRDIMWR
jgi:hypothetical protein